MSSKYGWQANPGTTWEKDGKGLLLWREFLYDWKRSTKNAGLKLKPNYKWRIVAAFDCQKPLSYFEILFVCFCRNDGADPAQVGIFTNHEMIPKNAANPTMNDPIDWGHVTLSQIRRRPIDWVCLMNALDETKTWKPAPQHQWPVWLGRTHRDGAMPFGRRGRWGPPWRKVVIPGHGKS